MFAKCLPCVLHLLPSEPWTMAYSKTSKMKFFFNKITKYSTYEMPPDSAAPFQYVPHPGAITEFIYFWLFCFGDM